MKAAVAGVPQLQALMVLMTLVVWWAMLRPNMVRDYDQRRLPNNSKARFLFVVFCLLVYVSLIVFFRAFGEVARQTVASVMPPVAHNFVDTFKDAETLMAFATMCAMMQFSFVRDLERSLLVWLHSARHLHGDSVLLAKHLERCKFEPGDDEREIHRDALRKYGVYVTDSGIAPTTFPSWRKVATLLRILREWNPPETRLLATDNMAELGRIETAHERKTQLAMTILKLVEQAEHGGIDTASLAGIMALLTNTSHANRDNIADIETKLKSALDRSSGVPNPAEKPLRLSSEAFKSHLRQIEGYFKVEYDLLLQKVADFTAQSVVRAGSQAPDRLEQLRSLGFGGLGRIEAINFDRILWLFMAVSVGGFLVMFIGNMGNPNTSADRLARFAFVMAVAALIGAMVGSNQKHARAISTPWGLYLSAGLAAAFMHLAINEIWEFARGHLQTAFPPDMSVTPAGNVSASPAPMRPVNIAPWTLLPCMVTIAVCRLGRMPRLPICRGPEVWRPILERTLDGFAISGAVFIGFYLAIGAHHLFGIPLPKQVDQMMKEMHGLKGLMMTSLQFMGFIIGFLAVRDVRYAAHASVLDETAPAAAASAPAAQAASASPEPAATSAIAAVPPPA